MRSNQTSGPHNLGSAGHVVEIRLKTVARRSSNRHCPPLNRVETSRMEPDLDSISTLSRPSLNRVLKSFFLNFFKIFQIVITYI